MKSSKLYCSFIINIYDNLCYCFFVYLYNKHQCKKEIDRKNINRNNYNLLLLQSSSKVLSKTRESLRAFV